MGDIPIMIHDSMIHKLIGLSNEGSNPVNVKNVKKLDETNLKLVSDGRNMKINKIEEVNVRLISKIIGYKMNYSSRVNFLPTGFTHTTFIMSVKKDKDNMCEIFRH